MHRRDLLKSSLLGSAAALAKPNTGTAIPKASITGVRFYRVSDSRPIFNQSGHIVTVETDAGVTGIGEGGSPDTVRQLGAMIIGENPFRIEHLWQLMYRGYFYPPGREKIHALGAIDLALWDIKAKALDVPVWHLLGGLTRNYVECYATGFPSQGSIRETARACIEAGFRAFRTGSAGSRGETPFQHRQAVDETYRQCQEIREGVGEDGDWAIDYHTRFDFADAVRLSSLLEPLRPIFCEDLVRSENPEVYRTLRPVVRVPIAVGEHFGDRWDANVLIEDRLIDYSRVSIPNCGGITEFMKLAALCETHYIGLIPHFTGPVLGSGARPLLRVASRSGNHGDDRIGCQGAPASPGPLRLSGRKDVAERADWLGCRVRSGPSGARPRSHGGRQADPIVVPTGRVDYELVSGPI